MVTSDTRFDVFGPTGATHRDGRDQPLRLQSAQLGHPRDDAVAQAQAALLASEFRLDADRQANARDCVKEDRKLIDKASAALDRARSGVLLSIMV